VEVINAVGSKSSSLASGAAAIFNYRLVITVR